jgi:O-antigen ligase/Tfp pilus assembly protein PilF
MNLSTVNHPVLVRTARRWIQAGILLLVFYFTLIGGFVLGVREYQWWSITLVMLGLLWGGWLLWRLSGRGDIPDTRLGYPLLLMLGATALATAFSTDPRMSGGRLALNIILAISLYFTLDWISDEGRAQLLVKAILITGGVVCLIGLLEFWQWYGGNWISPVNWRDAGVPWNLSASLRIKSVLHNPNYLAYYLVLLTGLGFYRLFGAKTAWRRGLWGSYLALVLITAILTQSRGGLLGVFTTATASVILFLWSRLSARLAAGRIRLGWVVLGGVLLFVSALIFLSPIIIRTDLSNASTFGLRNSFWQSATRMFLSHPLLGTGPATFPTQYMIYRDRAQDSAIYTHAHNVWFTIAVEYGIAGILSVGYFFIALAKITMDYLRRTAPSRWAGLLLAGVAILAGQGVHNLLDDFMEFPIFTWFTVLGVALCLRPALAQGQPLPSRRRRVEPLLIGGGMLLVAGACLWSGPAFATYDQARQAAEAGEWRQAASGLERAVEFDPGYRFYRQQLALAYGELARADESYLPLALAQQKQAVDQSDSYPPDVAYLACLYWQSGQPDRAKELMRTAISIAPLHTGGLSTYHLGQATFYFNLGYYYESTGELDLAQQAYAQVLLAFPQVGTSPYWQVGDSRRQMLLTSAGLARKLTDDSNLAAEIAYYSGDYQTALALFALPPADSVGQAKSLLALGQTERASELLAAYDSHPEAAAYVYQAQLLEIRGQVAQAETDMRKAIALLIAQPAYYPSYYYRRGRLAELQGNTPLAEDSYKRAIAMSTAIRTDYANLVGQRQPLPTEQPFCLMIPYPAEDLSAPSLALASLVLAQNDQPQAAKIYQDLLRHEPYNQGARQKLTELFANYPALKPETAP